MTHFSGYFHRFYTEPNGWLDLFAELSKARGELPKSKYQPTIVRRSGESLQESISRSLREQFEPISTEVAAATGDRFQDGHWPEKISDKAAYFLRVILTMVMKTIATIAPTPEHPLKPTVVPFPKMTVQEAALWFANEWWVATGGQLYEFEMAKKSAI